MKLNMKYPLNDGMTLNQRLLISLRTAEGGERLILPGLGVLQRL